MNLFEDFKTKRTQIFLLFNASVVSMVLNYNITVKGNCRKYIKMQCRLEGAFVMQILKRVKKKDAANGLSELRERGSAQLNDLCLCIRSMLMLTTINSSSVERMTRVLIQFDALRCFLLVKTFLIVCYYYFQAGISIKDIIFLFFFPFVFFFFKYEPLCTTFTISACIIIEYVKKKKKW